MPYSHSICFLIGIFSCFSLAAQPASTKFGKVEEAYIRMESYPQDTNAAAVYLYDYGEVSIGGDAKGFRKEYTFHKRIKILSESAVDLGDFKITYNRKDENISKLSAITYNVTEGGKIEETKLEKKDIFKDDLDGDYQRMSFSLPKVKKGTVIEVYYKYITPGFQTLRPWTFQIQDIPVIYSEYKTVVPQWFTFLPLLNGSLVLTDKKQDVFERGITIGIDGGTGKTEFANLTPKFVATSYIMKDVPAFVAEPYLTTATDHLSWIKFQLSTITWPNRGPENYLSSWNKLEEELLAEESFGMHFTKLGKLKKWQSPVPLTGLSDREKNRNNLDLCQENYGVGRILFLPLQ